MLRAHSDRGVIAARELVALGVPSATVYRRCRPGGPWTRLLPGVVLLSTGEATAAQRTRAALVHAGPMALVTGLAALRAHGFRRSPTPSGITVLVPAGRQVRTWGFAEVERTTRMPEPVVIDGTAHAPVVRAVLDAARRATTLDGCRSLVAEAVQTRRCTVAELAQELDAGSDRGSALPRRVLAEVGAGVRSVAEAHARTLWRQTGLPALEWNRRLLTATGALIAVPDGWLDDVGLAWEIDSYEFHLGPDDYRRTLQRHNRMAGLGIVVVHTLPSRLQRDRTAVIGELRAGYAAAARRPRPGVVLGPAA